MENTPTPNSDFENYLRKNLQQIDAKPDDNVWANIAGKQAQPNLLQKRRRYGMYAAGAVLLILSAVGYWSRQQSTATTNDAKAVQQQEQAVPGNNALPMAGVEPSTLLNTASSAATQNTKKHAFIPNFSPRVNSVPAASIRFQAENGIHYENPATGTSVNIPANSLVDQNGQAVTGESELFFREYRTIEEFLASGIPMHYADARGPFYFNSSGMFEVRVSQAGTPLQMAAGKRYDVNFSSTAQLDNASLYYLDDKTGEWVFRPDAAFDQAKLSQPPVSSELTVISNNLRGKKADCRPDPGRLAFEPEPSELVKLGVQTGFDLATGKLAMPKWFKKNPYLTDDQLLFRMERGLVQIKKHRDQSQLFFPEDLNKFFTELAAFKGCYFTYNLDSLGGGRSAKNITNGDYWQRITVTLVKDASCIITLYDGKEGQMQFHAELTGSTDNKQFNAEAVMAEYARLREERHQEFAKKNLALRLFLYAAPAFQPNEEWCYSPYEWLEYFENNHPLMARRYAALVKEGLNTDDALAANTWKNWQKKLRDQKFDLLEGITPSFIKSKGNMQYALSLSNFGVYNCDQIFRLGGDGTQFITATYKTSAGKQIIPALVSLMEARSKVFFTLPSSAKLLYNPNRKLDVIVTDRDGRQYHFPREKYAIQKFNTTGVTVLTLNDVTEETQSPRAWAQLLEI